MTLTTLRSNFDVDLYQEAGSDAFICMAARVSTKGADTFDEGESAGLINFLMSNRHGSPFEHGLMTFRVTAPIFVWREFMRHRIGFSYNEESGRYKILNGTFYVPPKDRPLIQVGKAGAYSFEFGNDAQYELTRQELSEAYFTAWAAYQTMLKQGVAKEVARMCLPVATYSTAYVSCNPRSLMSFLSLRTKHEDSTFPSYPQWEINQVADQLEEFFKTLYPLTHASFIKNGRVSP
jgi:thymidylate synthase (FAD)